MVEEFYTAYDEAGRLAKDKTHKIEYFTTMRYLLKTLPQGCSVLDCCTGCGVYAFPLAKAGYNVTAGDLVPKHIDYLNASEDRCLLKDVYQGNILNMSRFADNSFDAVLCFGALYHLFTITDREKAVAECLRVLKIGGVFLFSYINRNAAFINSLRKSSPPIKEGLEIMKKGLIDGRIFYGMNFDEPDQLAGKFGLKKIANVGTDGLAYTFCDEINALDDSQFDLYMQYQLETCEEPSIIGHSLHGLWIGKRIR